MTKKAIDYLYGHKIEITSIVELKNILDTAKFLQIGNLIQKISEQLCRDIYNHDTFQILDTGYTHELTSVCKACI